MSSFKAVPICIHVAPTNKNLTISSPLEIPPTPTTGTILPFSLASSKAKTILATFLSAIGLIAAPDCPPRRLPSIGLSRVGSISKASIVLIAEIASAPSSTAAFANLPIYVTFGESFTIIGILTSSLIALTTLLVIVKS